MILCIVGPTAVGKTKLSIALAKIFNGEIINADSVQIYKGLDVGSAKVTEAEKENIKHHLLDIKEVDEEYTIYHYQKDCRQKIAEIKKKGKIPILVGGSGLYIKSALYDYQFSEEAKDKDYQYSNEILYQKIKKVSPHITIDINNRQRLLRAYNKIVKNISLDQTPAKPYYDDVLFIGLETDSKTLYAKIDKRVDNMLIALVDEVKAFYLQNLNSQVLQSAIGYKELYAFFDNKQTFKESIDQIKQNSRNYAKRQYTFFKHQLPVHWFTTNYQDFSVTINNVVNYILENTQN